MTATQVFVTTGSKQVSTPAVNLGDCNTFRSRADVGCDATDALCTYWGIQQEESVKDMDLVPDLEAECATDLLRAKALFIMKIRDKRKLLQEKRNIKPQHILEAVPMQRPTPKTYIHTYTLSKELQRASVPLC